MLTTRNSSDGTKYWLHYPDIWKLSYLLEIQGKGWNELFTFSMPPESVEVVYPQRVSETKTFGGMFIDDYGPEACKINFSGSTGNAAIKKIYRKNQGDLWMTGKEEIFYIRDNIIRYKENHPDDYGEAKFYLYNLSAISEGELAGGSVVSPDSWEVVLKDFKISQNKDKPYFYSYSIEFVGLRILGKSKVPKTPPPVIIENTITDEIAATTDALQFLADMYAWSEKVSAGLKNVQKKIDDFKSKYEYYKALITGTIYNLVGLVQTGTGLVTSSISLGLDVYKTFWDVVSSPVDLALAIVDGVADIRKEIESVIDEFDENGTAIPDSVYEKWNTTKEAAESEWGNLEAFFTGKTETVLQDAEDGAARVYVAAISTTAPEARIIPDASGDDVAIVSYGSIRTIATSETTLEEVASRFFGDPNQAAMIALFNDLSGDTDITPGMQLKIPILDNNSLNTANYVFAPENRRDTIGIDIKLEEDGSLSVADNGDLAIVDDYENMNQAILLRLSESLGNRVRLNTYGIRSSVGEPAAAAAVYVATSIKDTVMQDPRVSKIENLVFTGAGDKLSVEFLYTTDDGIRRRFAGEV